MTDTAGRPPVDLGQASETIARIRGAVARVVIGNEEALDQLLVALLCKGHALLEDVPGVGKTLLARTLARVLGCEFRRLQLTPDVLPSDITGSNVFNQRTSEFEFRPGPLFTQILLADEINRATPRSQSALLEAMEERQVTVDGETRPLDEPFLVLATQNPVELEGTFPLPEAQLDRFALRVTLGYPSLEHEHEILLRFEHDESPDLVAVSSPDELVGLQRARGSIVVSDDVRSYLVAVIRSTREDGRLSLGASPRAALALHRAVQARALLHGRDFALPDDVKALAAPVVGHRIVLSAAARLRGATTEQVLDEILLRLAVPVEDESGEQAITA
jgi:MoxR-like ATPase